MWMTQLNEKSSSWEKVPHLIKAFSPKLPFGCNILAFSFSCA